MLNVILSFATETAGSSVIADMFKNMADFLYANKLRGNFHLTGDFARALRKHNRRDVIKALARHEIGYHCNHHGARPFMGGYCEREPWRQSVATWLAEETPGMKILEELFNRRPMYYTTEFVKAPQVVYGAWLAGMHSIGFMRGGPENKAPLPNAGQGAAWFCNMFVPSSHDLFQGLDDKHITVYREQVARLNMSPGVLRIPIHMYQVILDRANWQAYHLAVKQYRENIHYEDTLQSRGDGHWLAPAERPAKVAQLQKTLLQIAAEPGCRFIGYEDYRGLYHPGAGQWLTLAEMDTLAEQLTRALDAVVLGAVSISPAEAFGLFTRILRIHHETGDWPDQVAMRSLVGPVEDTAAPRERNIVVHPQSLADKLPAIDRDLDDYGHLPATVEVGSAKLGTGVWMSAMLALYRDWRAGHTPTPCSPGTAPDLPVIADDPFFQEGRFQHNMYGVPLYPDDFTGEVICRLSRLQSWSWKPAIRMSE